MTKPEQLSAQYESAIAALLRERADKQNQLDGLNIQTELATTPMDQIEMEELKKDIQLLDLQIAYAQQGINPLKAKLELKVTHLQTSLDQAQQHLKALGNSSALAGIEAIDFEETEKDIGYYQGQLTEVLNQLAEL